MIRRLLSVYFQLSIIIFTIISPPYLLWAGIVYTDASLCIECVHYASLHVKLLSCKYTLHIQLQVGTALPQNDTLLRLYFTYCDCTLPIVVVRM